MERPSAAVLLLAGLVAADVVLVTGAVRSTHVDTTALARALESSSTTVPSAASPASSGSSSAAGTSTPAGTTRGPTGGKVTLSALTGTRAWRASSAAVRCTTGTEPAAIGHTEDGGKHWTSVTVPLTTVSGLSYADGRIIATGTDSSCKGRTYALSSTFAPRTTTTTPAWSIDPADPTQLLSSGNPVADQPCSSGLLDIAANSPADVVALCADRSVRHSTDGGSSWNRATSPSGVLAIATGNDTVYAATRAACGIAVAPLDGKGTPNCVAGTANWSGAVDITIVGGTLWLAASGKAVTAPVAGLG